MLFKHKSKFSYDKTVSALSESIKEKQGWRVTTVNDYQKSTATFVALEHVGSVNICNPRYASKILSDDKDRGVTAFMPLGLGVYRRQERSGFCLTAKCWSFRQNVRWQHLESNGNGW